MTGEQAAVAALFALDVLVAIVWATIAALLWRLPVGRVPNGVVRPLFVVSMLVAAGYALFSLFTILPPAVHATRPLWLRVFYVLGDVSMVGAAAAFAHMAWRLPPVPTAGRRRLAALYGAAGLVVTLHAATQLLPSPPPALTAADQALYWSYFVVALVAGGWQIAGTARSGAWHPDTVFVTRRGDVAVIGALALAAFLMGALFVNGGWEAHPWTLHLLSGVTGLAGAVPLAARMLGAVLRTAVLVVAALLATAGVYSLAQLVILPRVDPLVAPAVHSGMVVAIVVLLVPGQRALEAAIDRLLLRRSRGRLAELQAFVHTLSPELGRLECTRRVVGAVVRVLGLRAAATILRDGAAFCKGDLDIDRLSAAWPRDAAADALPAHPFFGHELADGILRDLLVECSIACVVPIVSPRRRWGDLFPSARLLGTAFAEEDIETLETAAQQLALLLDGAELLERAVAVERSLAQAEKLAVIGETSARIAHDIRNPVTAARSLAQQLAREPEAPFREELHVILEELDRVERQVADLLQFARRKDLRFERVDLGALARATVAQLRPRLQAADVAVALDLEPAVAVWADRERLRQLIVNLVENAADALCGAPRRELSLRVAATNGSATLRVSDTGPGVPVDALSHLFEPFFSLKSHGTGLGLAIAKRTVDAHGGHITAAVRPEGGMVFDVGLPPASTGAA